MGPVSPPSLPAPQGLYDPAYEHDSCGIGFVADIRNRASHDIVRQGMQLLCNVRHRGAVGADPLAGDGAGILVQLPHRLLREECARLGVELPAPGRYGVGMVFLPKDEAARRACEEAFAEAVAAEGQQLLGWRDVPVDPSVLGESVKPGEPRIRQVFIGRGPGCADMDAFERKLLVIRKVVASTVERRGVGGRGFYVVTLSARTLCYKGMMLAARLDTYYPDLADERMESALALVHQRFSTNTFPSWQLAHPYRFLCHNGEINTIRGNINWMNSRRHGMSSPLLGEDLDKLWPIIREGISDSATFDNALELLVAGGYPLAHAMMLMIPEAWQDNPLMDPARRAFYEYHAALMEPWDGPAAIAFTDGRRIGATLDRNGLRPARYVVTDDHRIIMASEVGVIDVPEPRIVRKWRLQPGRMLLVDLDEGRIIDDEELKAGLAASRPWQRWLDETQIRLKDLPANGRAEPPAPNEPLLQRQQAFGYTREDLEFLMAPMAEGAEEAVGSMGADNPVAVLSSRPKPLANYFRQNFAQVTNPAIDSIREQLVMSLISIIGPRPNLLDLERAGAQGRVEVEQPILTNRELQTIREIEAHTGGRFRSRTIDVCYRAEEGAGGMEPALQRVCAEAEEAVRGHYNILILSDRAVDAFHVPIPSLLATAAVHHHLVRAGLRTETGLIVESGAAREVHHFSTLAGYGAEAVNPWLAYETLAALAREKRLNAPCEKLEAQFIKAIGKGLLKVMAKMGISTYQSYCGAQIFDAVGLASGFVDRYFTGTASRVEGIGIEEIAADAMRRHEEAWGDAPLFRNALDPGGDYAFRVRGEAHMWTPQSVAKLQHAVRASASTPSGSSPPSSTPRANGSSPCGGSSSSGSPSRTRAGMQDPEPDSGAAVPLEEVEPAASIVKRFSTGAMSFGSISYEAHTNLAIAMNRIGGGRIPGRAASCPSATGRSRTGTRCAPPSSRSRPGASG